MSIVMSRVDNRLLHGIIVTQWAPMSKANRVMVIDDSVANNDIQKSSMRLARPAGMAVSIITEETAIANFKREIRSGKSICHRERAGNNPSFSR